MQFNEAVVLESATHQCFFQYLSSFLNAVITQQSSPDDAFQKFDDIAAKHTEMLRKLTKLVQEARLNHDEDGIRKAIADYEDALERLLSYQI